MNEKEFQYIINEIKRINKEIIDYNEKIQDLCNKTDLAENIKEQIKSVDEIRNLKNPRLIDIDNFLHNLKHYEEIRRLELHNKNAEKIFKKLRSLN